ncbi:hypothetical protein LCGC14_2083750 [marine sediment metagenome]|uniref:ParB-like N-terminal domain-containing protein n=1 Tax=marine sediment metagenome TaxID=412755 RepID=A0A0F9HBU5_9ZZZZ
MAKSLSEVVKKIDMILIDGPVRDTRMSIDMEAVKELAESIDEVGLMVPILLANKGERFEVVWGHRRFLAHKFLGKTKILAKVQTLSESQIIIMRAIENIHREDITTIEEAKIYQCLMKDEGMEIEEIAKRMSSGYYPTIKYLILEGYLFFLTIEELLCTINVCKEKLDYPHYIKLIYEILEKWADIMYSSEDIHKRIFIRESMIKIFLGQLLDTKIHKYFEEFIDGIYDRLNEDLMYILHDYRSACIGLCYDYSEAGMYDKLQQHCTFLLSQDTKSSYIWEHLGIAYRNKGLTIYANAAENICQIKEKLKIKGIKKMLRKFKIKQFFWRHFFRFFTLNFWSIKKYHKWSVKKA